MIGESNNSSSDRQVMLADEESLRLFVEQNPEVVVSTLRNSYDHVLDRSGKHFSMAHEVLRQITSIDPAVMAELDRDRDSYLRTRRLAGLDPTD